MKPTRLLLLLLLLAPASPVLAQFQIRVGPTLGFKMDHESDLLVIGADARYDPHLDTLIVFNPRFNFYLEENATSFQIDLNALLNPCPGGFRTFSPYMGAGVAVQHFKFDDVNGFDGASSTDVGLNLLSGFYLDTNTSFQPFLQAQYTAVNNNPNLMVVSGGLLFRFNR